MTAPLTALEEFDFVSETPGQGASVPLAPPPDGTLEAPKMPAAYPPPILAEMTEEKQAELSIFLDQWLNELESAQGDKQTEWAGYEDSYRAHSEAPKSFPFRGASNETIPVIAMAVDPIHARLDTGVFKQEPVFNLKGLKKSVLPFIPSVSQFVDYYQKHQLKLRNISSPRLLECSKLGTTVFKTVYHKEEVTVRTYDESFNVTPRIDVRFKGPKVFGIPIHNFMFPDGYQHLQDVPMCIERQRTTMLALRKAEASGMLTNVDKLKNQDFRDRTETEDAESRAARHEGGAGIAPEGTRDIVVHEYWFEWDINGDGKPERMVVTYHRKTRTFLQIRFNWYFHQRYPYTLIPYTIATGTLYGVGIAEMTQPFQKAITRFHQMASDNAYLANIRMFIVKKNAGYDEPPRLYAGRTFPVDEPTKDFIPFSAGDIYPSTITERQNMFGMVEKRTGVSDYLTGRESPVIGSRATATSTLALIKEGTRRVEEVLENLREGFAEIMENVFYIWIQYGLGDIDDIVFGDDKIAADVKQFFSVLSRENVNGAVAIDLTVSDAGNNRQAETAMQLQLIQIMMQYLEKVLEAGQSALLAQEQLPQYTEMIKEVMSSARLLFSDLLTKFDIRNPEDFLPDLEKFLNAPNGGPGGGGPAEGLPGGPQALGGLPAGRATLEGSAVPSPARPGDGGVAGRVAEASGLS